VTLNPDKVFVTPNGGELRLPDRSLMLIRNVGHHMYTDAVLDPSRREIPEGNVGWSFRPSRSLP